MILGSFDWLPHVSFGPPSSSRCIDAVQRAAAAAGGSRLNFVPTMYWRDSWPSDGGVDSFCYMNSDMSCVALDHASIESFRSGMQRCFQAAVHLGMSISVVPHLDDGSGQSAWRNGLVFSPTTKYGGYSYEEVVLNPLADALAAVVPPTTRVWMGMQGEMSATICRYPSEYISLMPRLKARIAGADQSAERLSHIKVGVALNYNKLERGNTGSPISAWASLLMGRRPAAYSQPGIDKASLQRLFEVVDFVGISSYAALTPNFGLDELQDAAYMFFDEFKAIGIDLASIMQRRGIELHYTEYGLGGGTSSTGRMAANSAEAAAKTPFFGVWGSYRRGTDPWTRPAVRDYMHTFWRRSLQWLEKGGGPTYHITACFLWDLGSWDVLGVYTDSTTREGSFRDEEVAAMIRAHNSRVGGPPAALRIVSVPPPSAGILPTGQTVTKPHGVLPAPAVPTNAKGAPAVSVLAPTPVLPVTAAAVAPVTAAAAAPVTAAAVAPAAAAAAAPLPAAPAQAAVTAPTQTAVTFTAPAPTVTALSYPEEKEGAAAAVVPPSAWLESAPAPQAPFNYEAASQPPKAGGLAGWFPRNFGFARFLGGR